MVDYLKAMEETEIKLKKRKKRRETNKNETKHNTPRHHRSSFNLLFKPNVK